jgi:hypothetical protein
VCVDGAVLDERFSASLHHLYVALMTLTLTLLTRRPARPLALTLVTRRTP